MIFQMIVNFFLEWYEMLWNEIEYIFYFLIVSGEIFLECTWIKHSGSFNSKKCILVAAFEFEGLSVR